MKKKKQTKQTFKVVEYSRPVFDPTEGISDEEFTKQLEMMPLQLLISEFQFLAEYMGYLYIEEGRFKKNPKARLVSKRMYEMKEAMMKKYNDVQNSLEMSEYWQDHYYHKSTSNNDKK